MAYDPTTGAWKYEDDSVEGNVKGLVDVNSPIIQQARTQGVESANRRGLINSSISAGASQNAAYTAAVPIATADAQITNSQNLSAQGAAQNLTQGAQTIQGQKDVQAQSDAATNQRLIEQLGSQEKVSAAQDAAAKERLGMQLTSQEQIAADQLKTALQQTQMTNDTSIKTNAATNQASTANTALTVKANQDTANAQLNQQAQQFVVTATQQARSNYDSVVNNINSNPNIPADARGGYLADAKANFDADIKAIAAISNVQIPYSTPVVPGSTGGDAVTPGGNTTGGGSNPTNGQNQT